MEEFDKRPKDRGPFVVGDKPNGVRSNISVGDTVTLHLDGISVIAVVTKRDGNTFRGTITGFEQYASTEYKGLREGSSVDFSFDHIFGCTKTT